MIPGDFHQVHQNLEALIRLRQAPVIRILLRRRFLTALSGSGISVWSAYGFDVARSLIADLELFDPVHLSPDEIAALDTILSIPEVREVPPHADEPDWSDRLDRENIRLKEAAESIASLLREGWSHHAGERAVEDHSEAGLFVPVVAPLRGIESAHPIFQDAETGLVVPLRVRVDGMFHRAAKPDLSLNVRVGEGIERSLHKVLGGLDALGIRGLPSLRKCLFRLFWIRGASTLEGRSFELAFFIASAVAWSLLGIDLSRRSIRDGVAVTGLVENDLAGPVSEKTLVRKVAACFYSPVRLLCVPNKQRRQALAHVRRLEEKHPGRQLTIRGVGSVRDLWDDPAVIRRQPRTVPDIIRTLFRRLAMSRALVGAIVLLLMLFGLLVTRDALFSQNLPFSAEWEEGEVVVRNVHGRITTRIRPSGGKPGEVTSVSNDQIGTRLGVWDLDGDGVNEIMVVHKGSLGNFTQLSVYNRDGTILWNIDSRRTGFAGDETISDLSWFCVYPMSEEGVASHSITAIRRMRQGSLSCVDRIDVRSGRHLGLIWNPGHIGGMFLFDVDGDGRKEACISATDNTSSDGIMGIIRPGDLTATNVKTDLSGAPSMAGSTPFHTGLLFSLRFSIDRFSSGRAHVHDMIMMQNGLISVFVRGTSRDERTNNFITYSIRIGSDFSPVVEDVRFTDAYKTMIQQWEPDVSPDQIRAEEQRLQQNVTMMTESGWTSVP